MVILAKIRNFYRSQIMKRTSPLESSREKQKGGFKKESLREERLHLLSKFLRNRNRGFKRSKRKSSTSRQGLRIETGVGEF